MKVRSTLGFLSAWCALLLAACTPETEQQTAESVEMAMPEPEASADVLADLRSQYVEHYNMGHAPMVAELYATDAILLDANGRVVRGREAIAADLEAAMATSPALEVTAADRIEAGGHVVERGSYRLRLTPEGGEPVTSTGHYMTLNSMSDGEWKIQWLGVNTDAPSAMPMPPAAGAAQAEPGRPASGPLADLAAAYAQHLNLGHADMVADLYAEDGVAMVAERPLIEGRAAIQADLAARIAEGSPQIQITPAETRMLGEEWAVGRGRHTVTATVEGQSVRRSGHHVILARRQADGSWKIHWALSNLEPAASSST